LQTFVTFFASKSIKHMMLKPGKVQVKLQLMCNIFVPKKHQGTEHKQHTVINQQDYATFCNANQLNFGAGDNTLLFVIAVCREA
jgi:hypothetical protein